MSQPLAGGSIRRSTVGSAVPARRKPGLGGRAPILAILLASFCGGSLPLVVMAAETLGSAGGGFDYDRLRFWIGGGLLLLGVIGVSLVLLLGRQRRLVTQRDEFKERIDAASDRQRGA